MRLLSVLLFGAVALTVVPAQFSPLTADLTRAQSAARNGTAATAHPVVGTLVAMRHVQSSERLSVARVDGTVVTVVLGTSVRLVTRDGHPLAAAALRAGDQLSVWAGSRVQDMSQGVILLHGVVSMASGDTNGSIAVQVNHSWDVLVDTTSLTRYIDRSRVTSTVSQVQEGDEVQLAGLYDRTMGEMTQAFSLSRFGPVRLKSGTHG